MAGAASFQVQDAVVVVPPDGSLGDEAARIVDSVWLRHGKRIEIVSGDRVLTRELNGPAIVLGCLADNPFVASLYERYATLVDRWYPGTNGWVVQFMASVHRPGAHVLLLGGSNAEGVGLATSSWLQQLPADGHVAWQLQVCLGAEHESLPADRIDCLGTSASQVETPDSALPTTAYESAYPGGSIQGHLLRLGMYGPHADNFHLSRSSQLGLRYLYSGRTQDARAYRLTLLDEVRIGVVQTLYHYKSIRMFQLWAMLSGADVFSDDERAEISGAMRAYLLQESGMANKEALEKAASKDHEIFSRHVACDALNLWVGADWLWRQTGETHWLEDQAVADRYFEAQAGTDVPLTGLTEGYASYLEVYLEWLLLRAPDRIVQDPHVRLWAERVIGLCTNGGQLVLGPQTDAARYPYNLLRKLACVFDDGRYLYVADLRERQVVQGMDRVMQFSAGQAWASDTQAVEPVDQIDLIAFPMNERLRQWQAPSIGVDRGFDRAVARAGWSQDDDYLLLVGVRSGGKSLPNVGTLAAYERFGQRLITSDLVPLYPRSASPWRHSRTTVSIDGLGVGIAEGAQVLQQGELAGGHLLSFEVCSPGHHRWTRTVYWQPSAFVLVVDCVVDETDGARTCTLGVNWRCGGRLLGIDDGLAALAFADGAGPGRFFVEVSSSLCLHDSTEDYPAIGGLAEAEPTTEQMLHGLMTREAGAGDIEVATLLHAVSETHEPCYRLAGADSRWTVVGDEATHELARDGDGNWVASVGPQEVPEDQPPAPAVRAQGPAALPRLDVGWAVDLPAPATVWAQGDNGGMAIGTEAGEVVLLDSDGKVQHSTRCRDAITALTSFEAGLLVGTRAGEVSRVDGQGQVLWRYDCQFRPERSFWPWWFLPTPAVGALAGACDATTGEQVVVAGTGSSSLNFLDGHTGALRSDVVSPYGLPDRIETGSQAGEPQFLVGHNWLTCGSTVQAWTLQAQAGVKYCRSVDPMGRAEEGWDSCGVVAFYTGQLARGMSPCVVVLRHGAVNQLTLYDEASGDPLWDVGLGDAPVAMCVSQGATVSAARIHVAGQFGELVQLDGHGKRLTTVRLADSLQGMHVTHDDGLALWSGAELLLTLDDHVRRYPFEAEPLGWYADPEHQGLLCRKQTQLLLHKADQ